MGTGGTPGGFDIQKFFKTSNQPGYESMPTSYPPSSSPFPLPNQPNPFYSGSYSMLAASYPISSQGVSHHQYLSFSQERGPRPSPQYLPPHFGQPSFNQSSPSQLPQSLFVPGSAYMPLQQPAFSSPSGPSDSGQLMAILANQSASAPLELPPSTLGISMSDISQPSTAVPAMPSAPPVSLISGRVSTNKVPRGRKLKGKQIVYDVDDRLSREEQPQLEVSDITKYSSDPSLMLGRQIAVNKSYICYALRPNRHIRVLHMDSASRNLLRGHSQRVTDMVFFADDVHLLASASSDGRVFVRKILEGLGDDGKPQITDHVLLGILFTGDWGLVHPRVCWHSHTQDVLVVGISNYVLTIHVPTVQKEYAHDNFTAEEPILCSIDSPIEGVDIIIRHEGEVTDVSMSYGAKLVSGSKDGREGLRVSLESSVVPSFERACQAMFVQVETALQNGMAEYYSHSQQQLVSSHGNLASTLQEALASASSLVASLKGDLAESQRKLLKLLETTGIARTTHMPPSGNLPDKAMTVQSVEESLDPTKVLTRLIRERKLEEAFSTALSRADVSVVSWLCSQVDPGPLFETTPVPLSQGVILSLVQQLGWDLGNDTNKKLMWIREACLALNPHDRALAPHMRHFLEQLYSNLHSLMSTTLSPELVKLTRLVMHVVNSLLTACKAEMW